MKVESLTLRDFRNIRECTYVPERHLNFLVGANGQGKTSILEALGFFGTLRSFRGSRTHEVVRTGTTAADISCKLSLFDGDSSDWKTDLRLIFSMTDEKGLKANKVALINGKAFKSSTQYLSQRFGSEKLGFHSVVFNPSDHDLVRGEPSIRRAYLDRVLSAEDVEYLKIYQKYRRILEQRNALLKEGEQAREVLLEFSTSLVTHGALLAWKRLNWLNTLADRLDNAAHGIVPNQPVLRLIYISNWVPDIPSLSLHNNNLTSPHFAGQRVVPSLQLLEQTFWNQLSTLESAEWRAGCSLVGPHRDDWTLFLGNDVLKGRGSQGEVRSALMALKLSEIELFRQATGHRPLFLLDDFSSELDRDRREFLLRYLSETDLQVFVTSTEGSAFPGKRTWVVNGSLRDSEEHGRAASEENRSERIFSG